MSQARSKEDSITAFETRVPFDLSEELAERVADLSLAGSLTQLRDQGSCVIPNIGHGTLHPGQRQAEPFLLNKIKAFASRWIHWLGLCWATRRI